MRIYPTDENYTKLSSEALNSLFEKQGNATAINYFTAILFGFGNLIHVDKGILKDSEFTSHKGLILHTLLERIPKNYNYPHVKVDNDGGYIFLVDLVYQKSPAGIWIWINNTGSIEPLIEPLHRIESFLTFYKGFISYPFRCIFDTINITLIDYNATFYSSLLKEAKNFNEYSNFV